MKRVTDLTPADLQQVAIWRYEGELDEVAVVHATDRRELSGDEAGLFIAHTQFVLANGASHVGFCTPSADGELDSLQPVIVTGEGNVYFWFDEPPSVDSLRAQWNRLGVGREEVFPIHYRCTVPVGGRFITGTIEADELTGPA